MNLRDEVKIVNITSHVGVKSVEPYGQGSFAHVEKGTGMLEVQACGRLEFVIDQLVVILFLLRCCGRNCKAAHQEYSSKESVFVPVRE